MQAISECFRDEELIHNHQHYINSPSFTFTQYYALVCHCLAARAVVLCAATTDVMKQCTGKQSTQRIIVMTNKHKAQLRRVFNWQLVSTSVSATSDSDVTLAHTAASTLAQRTSPPNCCMWQVTPQSVPVVCGRSLSSQIHMQYRKSLKHLIQRQWQRMSCTQTCSYPAAVSCWGPSRDMQVHVHGWSAAQNSTEQCMTRSELLAVPGFPPVWLSAHHLQHTIMNDQISFWQCGVSRWCNYRLITYNTSQCMVTSELLSVPGFPLV